VRKLNFLIPFTVSASLILSVVAGINVGVDVRGVYGRDQTLIESYVHTLTEAPNGLVAFPMERAMKMELARTSQARCFILGSSRVMLIGRKEMSDLGLRCPSLSNLGVSGAGFEDLVTMANQLHGKLHGAIILLSVDPWTLKTRSDLRYLEEITAYAEGRRRLGLADDPSADDSLRQKLANLVNGQYFLRNINFLTGPESRTGVIAVNSEGTNISDVDSVIRSDGSRQRSRAERATKPLPDIQVGRGNYKISPPYLDPTITSDFETVLEYFESEGARLVLFMAPYHPKVMRCESTSACAAIKSVSDWVRALADRRNLPLVGGFDPRPFGLQASDFSDDLHMTETAFPRLRAVPLVRPLPSLY